MATSDFLIKDLRYIIIKKKINKDYVILYNIRMLIFPSKLVGFSLTNFTQTTSHIPRISQPRGTFSVLRRTLGLNVFILTGRVQLCLLSVILSGCASLKNIREPRTVAVVGCSSEQKLVSCVSCALKTSQIKTL